MGSRSKNDGKKSNRKWVITIVIWSILIGGSVTLLSDTLLREVDTLVAFIILVFIVSIGIAFDAIGVAVTAADEAPFHSMASKKIPEGKIAVNLIRNADKVSNVCNDVVGDICGIVSGSVGILILQKIVEVFPKLNMPIASAFVGAIIASVTIGGKALGKGIAINKSNNIIHNVAKVIKGFKKLSLKRKDDNGKFIKKL
ncbi:hypothetical protein [Haloimpatiens lingqiaonensis]|uniref:hypothetical protein n=1 Tax=Haloimpatiens lingqiaonensis TaxID=1380675 RepID=UPI0010FDB179|nr:hypothetical protein [Haloimpatiens lingqiaonensis]